MKRLKKNFLVDGVAMTKMFQHLSEGLTYYDPEFFAYLKINQADDLLFCYRWLLLEMKREFAFEDSLQVLGNFFFYYLSSFLIRKNKNLHCVRTQNLCNFVMTTLFCQFNWGMPKLIGYIGILCQRGQKFDDINMSSSGSTLNWSES